MESKITKLLKQTQHYDKDERFMATSDLISELEKHEGAIEAALQIKIRNAIFKQLEDASIEVQTEAVKCLSMLVKKFEKSQVQEIVVKLGTLVVGKEKEESRDIYALGLKTILGVIPVNDGDSFVGELTRSLLIGLKSGDVEIILTALDLLKDVSQKFGSHLLVDENKKDKPSHGDIIGIVLPLLEHKSDNIRKRASAVIGALVQCLADADFETLVEKLLTRMEASKSKAIFTYTYLQTIGVISQSAGQRVGKFLKAIIPKLEVFCKIDEKEAESVKDEKVELWENCLQAFQSIINQCPNEVTPFVPNIIKISLKFLKYDPNYTYEDDESEPMEIDEAKDDGWGEEESSGSKKKGEKKEKGWGGDEDWDGGDEQSAAQEDDDPSWKARRAAVRCISTFIRMRSDLLKDYYESLCNELISSFKERDSNVQVDVFAAMGALLQNSVVTKRPEIEEKGAVQAPKLIRTRSAYETLSGRVGSIVKEALKQINRKDIEVQKGVLNVFRELISARQGGLDEYLKSIMPQLAQLIDSPDLRIKSEALSLASLIIAFHPADSLAEYVDSVLTNAIKATKDPYVKVKAESLRLLGAFAKYLPKECKKKAQSIYQACHAQLLLKDIDQEVKEIALMSMAEIISSWGTLFDTQEAVSVIFLRLSNELTRMPALRSIAKIAGSEAKLDMKAVVETYFPMTASFLRKESQALRLETVRTLTALTVKGGRAIPADSLVLLLGEIAPHISDADLHMSQLVLDLVSSILLVSPTSASVVKTKVIDRVLKFLSSPLLQGAALASVVKFFETSVGIKGDESLSYDSLLPLLLKSEADEDNINIHSSHAQCIAAMAARVAAAQFNTTVKKFVDIIKAKAVPTTLQIALFSLGEIGRSRDLSEHKQTEEVIFAVFDNQSDSVRNAASFALGNIAVGNTKKYLPYILGLIEKQPKHRDALFISLKEVIHRHTFTKEDRAAFSAYIAPITSLLLANTENKEESVQGIVAECLGGLALIDSENMFPKMIELVSSPKVNTRVVVITAIRHAISPHLDSSTLQTSLHKFLPLLEDKDLNVRRQTISTITALAHAKGDLITRELASYILPILYREIKPDEKYIRVVDLGCFKHKTDDALPLRKAAYQSLLCLVEVAPHRVDLIELVRNLQPGFKDENDAQILAYQLLYVLARNHGEEILGALDSLPDAIMDGVKVKLKEAKSEEAEVVTRAVDVLRSTVRALHACNSITGVQQRCQEFSLLYLRVLKTQLLSKLLSDMTKE